MFKMVFSFAKISLRNLVRSKVHAAITLGGLILGIATSLLLMQYVAFEYNYDNAPERSEHIYRVHLDSYQKGTLALQSARTYPGIAPTLMREVPNVEATARLVRVKGQMRTHLKARNDKISQDVFAEEHVFYADASFVDMFSVKMLHSASLDKPSRVLHAQNTCMIAESLARKYFGENSAAMRKTLYFRSTTLGVVADNEPFVVQGVYKDFPSASHLKPDVLLSYPTFAKLAAEPAAWASTVGNPAETSWTWYDFYTYCLLKPNTSPQSVETALRALVEKFRGDIMRKRNRKEVLTLQALRDIHLYSHREYEIEPNEYAATINALAAIAFAVLAIAWINFINLSTARSTERAKEIGIRKTSGASRSDVFVQFFVEALVLNIVAFLVAVLLVEISLPLFGELLDKKISLSLAQSLGFWAISVVMILCGTVLAAWYPSLVVSRFEAVRVLKGSIRTSRVGLLLRKSLIILQFASVVVLIVFALVVHRQIDFMRSYNLGFNTAQTLVFHPIISFGDSVSVPSINAFRASVLNLAGVRSATASNTIPGDPVFWTSNITTLGANTHQHSVTTLAIDDTFLPSYQVEFTAGRNFSREYGTDHNSVVINPCLMRLLHYQTPEEALGKRFAWQRDTLTIIGVTSSFRLLGAKTVEAPTIFVSAEGREPFDYISVQLFGDNIAATVERVEALYKQIFPDNSGKVFFLDDFFARKLEQERQFGWVLSIFSGMAIIIASLGLLGLLETIVRQRTKEIGIRKVLGASLGNIVLLLWKDFALPLSVGIALAVPLARFFTTQWLQDFAERVTPSFWVYVIAALIACGIAALITAQKTVQASNGKPVKALRYE
jgi:putative ABC transport system permease protein